jgi:hypothetical protein
VEERKRRLSCHGREGGGKRLVLHVLSDFEIIHDPPASLCLSVSLSVAPLFLSPSLGLPSRS